MIDLEKLSISPEVWPDKELEVQPGDLSVFIPNGNGVYGYQNKSYEPIKGAPPNEESGGVVYFGNGAKKEDLGGLLNLLGVRTDDKDFAVFINSSSDPNKDKYFAQMRLVSKFGLRFMFGAIDNLEYDSFKEQELSVEEALLGFIEHEKNRFGTSFGDSRIEGKMGGDGNYAREELSFGFMMENKYHDIYRIWSRAWLVTK